VSRDAMPETEADRLLQRYREANAFDSAGPGPALRDAILAHARQVAGARLPAVAPRPAAANDSAWNWKALGSLAAIGLLGLLVLQFDRGSPEEKEMAFGTNAPTVASSQVMEAPGGSAPEKPPALTGPTTPSPAESAASSSAPQPSRFETAPAAPAQPAATTPQPPGSRSKAPAPAPVAAPTEQAHAQPPQGLPAPSVAQKRTPAPAQAPAAASERPAPPPAPAPATSTAADAPPLAEAQAPPAAAAPAPDTVQGVARERRTDAAARTVPTALLTAIADNDPERVRQRLAEGANPNQRDGRARTPLMAAAQRGNAEIVRLLLAAGADPTLRDAQGLSAADLAERANYPALLPLLQ